MVGRRTRSSLALALAFVTPLAGCFSVLPGYSAIGSPISQFDRDHARAPFFFMWNDVPDPPHELWNPGALLVNLGASVVLDVSLVGVLCVIDSLERDRDEDRRQQELDDQAEAYKRKGSGPQIEPGSLRNSDGSFRPVQPP